jgi:flagellar biogenesis protein FliO
MTFMAFGETSEGEAKKSIFSNSASSSFSQKNSETPNHNLTESLHKMTLAVLIVTVLGVVVMYVSKKILPKLSNLEGRNIKVIETLHLGSRKTVHLLEVSGQQILLGSTSDRIIKLADIFSEKAFPLSKVANDDEDGATE